MFKVKFSSNKEKLNVKRFDKDFESKEKAERYMRSMVTYIPEEFFGGGYDEEMDDEDYFEAAYMCYVKEEGEDYIILWNESSLKCGTPTEIRVEMA